MKRYLQSRKRIICIFAPALIGLLYLVLCLLNINQSIWFDESYSSYITRFDFGQMLNFTANDVHPPLYYIVLKTWAHFFGHTDYAMRTLSAIFGAIAILFAFLWLKYKYGLSVASLGAFMLAISPVLVRYGQEMRMYTMVIAIVFAATYFLQLAIDNGKKRWWAIYAILVAVGMYIHYFSAFAWVAHLVYLFRIYGKKIFNKTIILSYLSSVILFLPWIPSLLSQTKTVQSGFWIGDVSAKTVLDYFTETLLYDRSGEIKNWLLVLFMATIITACALVIRYRKKLNFLIIMAIVPVIILVILSMPPLTSMFVSRYILYAMAAVSMLEACVLVLYAREKYSQKLPKNCPFYRRPAVKVAVIAALLIGTSICGLRSVYTYGNYNFVTDNKSTSKDLYENIVALDGSDNLSIIAADPWLYYDLAAYTSEHHDINFIDEQTDYIYGSLLPLKESYFGKINDLDKFLEGRSAIWYVGQVSESDADSGTMGFPRDGWRTTTEATVQFHDKSSRYRILKLERE